MRRSWKACSWFASNGPPTAGIRKRLSSCLRFVVLEPQAFVRQSFSGRLYATERALWKLNWFLRDFGYDMELLSQDQMDEKALVNLRGVVRTTHITLNGHTFQNLKPSPRQRSGKNSPNRAREAGTGITMIYSYTQISQYLRCPRSYRYRYLDGWREKDTRAAMVFGRWFEKALGAYFDNRIRPQRLFKEWATFRDTPFEYRKGESWDRLLHQGVHLLEKFVRDDRVRVPHPKENLQLKITRSLAGGNEFVSYIDAIGELDGKRCLIDWKTTTSRYSEEPEGLLSLDPQLICYSWISGIPDVAFVVFVRKQLPEIQYLKATISEEQRQEFGRLVQTTIQQLESGHFSSHSGIRFPQNGCVSCAHLGLCLGNQHWLKRT